MTCCTPPRSVAALIIGLLGSAPTVHMEATRSLLRSLAIQSAGPSSALHAGSALPPLCRAADGGTTTAHAICAVAVGDLREIDSMSVLRQLGSAVSALGLVAANNVRTPVERQRDDAWSSSAGPSVRPVTAEPAAGDGGAETAPTPPRDPPGPTPQKAFFL